jgi:hypothetical protein
MNKIFHHPTFLCIPNCTGVLCCGPRPLRDCRADTEKPLRFAADCKPDTTSRASPSLSMMADVNSGSSGDCNKSPRDPGILRQHRVCYCRDDPQSLTLLYVAQLIGGASCKCSVRSSTVGTCKRLAVDVLVAPAVRF